MLNQQFDRLVFRTFFQHWGVVAALLLGMFMGLDLLGHSDEISESSRQYGGIFKNVVAYFLLNLPFQLVQFAPYITLLAGMAAVMNLSRSRQWTPVLTAGRSAARCVVPILLGGMLVGLGVMGLRELVLPQISAPREAQMRKVFHQREWLMAGLSARTSDNFRLQAGLFSPETAKIKNLEVYSRGIGASDRLLMADSATWSEGKWLLENGREIDTGKNQRTVSLFKHNELSPDDLIDAYFASVSPLELSAAQLKKVLTRDLEHRQAATLLWSLRFAPFAHLILLLLGIPFVLRFERRSSIDGFAWGLFISMMFFVAQIVFIDLGARGTISPFWGGGAASLLFAAIAMRGLGRQPGLIAR